MRWSTTTPSPTSSASWKQSERGSWWSEDSAPSSSSSHERPERRAGSYKDLRRNLGRSILLGVEVLIIADIVRTIIVDQTFESVVVLVGIVTIRIVLSFSLEVEMDGVWPWNRLRGKTPNAVDAPAD